MKLLAAKQMGVSAGPGSPGHGSSVRDGSCVHDNCSTSGLC